MINNSASWATVLTQPFPVWSFYSFRKHVEINWTTSTTSSHRSWSTLHASLLGSLLVFHLPNDKVKLKMKQSAAMNDILVALSEEAIGMQWGAIISLIGWIDLLVLRAFEEANSSLALSRRVE